MLAEGKGRGWTKKERVDVGRRLENGNMGKTKSLAQCRSFQISCNYEVAETREREREREREGEWQGVQQRVERLVQLLSASFYSLSLLRAATFLLSR